MAETNGVAEIRVGGITYPLLFGRAAAQEMSDRTLSNLSGNPVKLLTDLVYSGMMNNAILNSQKFPSQTEVYLLVEDFSDEKDMLEQEKALWDTFEASKWGSKWNEEIAEVKKKATELLATLSQ